MPDFQALLTRHRPELLRHCYRMLGSFADAEDQVQEALLKAWEKRDSFRGDGSMRGWLFAIATNTCLNALASRRRLELPQAEYPASPPGTIPAQELESSRWLTPAPDARLFPDPHEAAELRESVALAFLAALQRLPAKQRAALLLKDVVGLSAEEIAEALELTVAAVNSALHRARESVGELPPQQASMAEPPPEALRAYVRSWEEHDLEKLTALLREDVILAMPPHAVWFRGREAVVRFLGSPRFQEFWSAPLRVVVTRANGLPALGFFSAARGPGLHSIGLTRFEAGQVAEMTVFIGRHFQAGFDIARPTERFPGSPLS
jgi:RNA polymerase sigma-70 factor (ECF subfamily)